MLDKGTLKVRIQELEDEVSRLKLKVADVKEGKDIPILPTDEAIEELQTEINVWKEKYNFLKEMAEKLKTRLWTLEPRYSG